jgi:transposase
MPSFLRRKRLHLAVHPPYSPDLAPSEFFLFGYIKHCLQGIAFPSREKLLATIHEIVGAIPQRTFEEGLWRWIERRKWVSQNNGDDHP